MTHLSSRALTLSALALVAGVASAQSASVDGLRGSEWTGIVPKSVAYDAAAPLGNFGAPEPRSHTVAYDIYFRADNDFVYGLLEAKPAGAGLDSYDGSFNWANVYFDSDPADGNGSDFLFEIGGNSPSVINAYSLMTGAPVAKGNAKDFGVLNGFTLGSNYGSGGTAAIVEFAIPTGYLVNDPQNVGFDEVAPGGAFQLRLSQSFGYSVAGGPSYGAERLGQVNIGQPVPEPATLAALGLGGLALLRRRRRASK